jgi:hypothetical protein
VIVIDDGSSDRTLDIVCEFTKAFPIRLITLGRIGNWMAVSNIGLREAQGEWACFLHQDDTWLHDRMLEITNAIEDFPGQLIVSSAKYITPNGEVLGSWTCPLAGGLIDSHSFIERLLVQNFLAVSSPVFRRQAAIESGGLDESLWFTADWDFWLRLGAISPVLCIPKALAGFGIHSGSQTAARPLQENEWHEQLTTVFDRHFPKWSATSEIASDVYRVAVASINVNLVLAHRSRGESARFTPVIRELLALGPSGWHRYLRDSRIVERLWARLKARRSERVNGTKNPRSTSAEINDR